MALHLANRAVDSAQSVRAGGSSSSPVARVLTRSRACVGRYYNGVKEKRLPGRVTDATTQDRTWALGESLVARVFGADGRTA